MRPRLSLRFVATLGAIERIVYARDEKAARRVLPLTPCDGPRWVLRIAGCVSDGVLHLPEGERSRLLVDGRVAPGAS